MTYVYINKPIALYINLSNYPIRRLSLLSVNGHFYENILATGARSKFFPQYLKAMTVSLRCSISLCGTAIHHHLITLFKM